MKTLFLLLFFALPLVAAAQAVSEVGLSGTPADSTGINTPIGGGAEQIGEIVVVLRYRYAVGDTLHAAPAESARGRFTLLDASGAAIVVSREYDILTVPPTVLPNADKIKARDFMDAVRDAIISRRADLSDSQ